MRYTPPHLPLYVSGFFGISNRTSRSIDIVFIKIYIRSSFIHIRYARLESEIREVNMKRILVTAFALFAGFMALITSLLLAIPLTIAALVTGKRIQNQMRAQGFNSTPENAHVIEGEFEEMSSKSGS